MKFSKLALLLSTVCCAGISQIAAGQTIQPPGVPLRDADCVPNTPTTVPPCAVSGTRTATPTNVVVSAGTNPGTSNLTVTSNVTYSGNLAIDGTPVTLNPINGPFAFDATSFFDPAVATVNVDAAYTGTILVKNVPAASLASATNFYSNNTFAAFSKYDFTSNVVNSISVDINQSQITDQATGKSYLYSLGTPNPTAITNGNSAALAGKFQNDPSSMGAITFGTLTGNAVLRTGSGGANITTPSGLALDANGNPTGGWVSPYALQYNVTATVTTTLDETGLVTPKVAVSDGIDMNGSAITNLAAGVAATDAVNKGQLDTVATTANNAATAAAAAQGSANTALADAASAQSTANTAVTKADAAQSTANTALANAATAQTTANTAVTKADAAQTTANTALANAATAQTTADTAVAKADAAQGTANTALANAATAQTTANTAVTKADAAQATANTALNNAATAQTAANTAQTTANTAVTKADAAQSTANTAVTKADAAQGTANTALANAATAQTTANTAVTKADAAQGTANTALANAAAAQTTANTAVTKADAAQTAADTAQANAAAALAIADGAATVAATADAKINDALATINQTAALIDVGTNGDQVAIGLGSNVVSGKGVSIGSQNQATGNGAVAIGDPNIATGQGAVAIGADNTATGQAAIALGNLSVANGQSAVALGDRANAVGASAIAIGQQANAAYANSIALGSGATTTRANQVKLGGAGSSVTLGDIAASTAAQVGQTDIMTVDASGTVGRDTTLRPAIAALQSFSTTAGNRLTALEAGQASLFNLVEANRKEARRGIAVAAAMAPAHFPSEAGKTSYSANSAIYRGEVAFSVSLAHRFDGDTPFALTAGVSHAGSGDTAARVGVAGEF